MADRASSGCFEFLPLRKYKTALKAFGRFDVEMVSGHAMVLSLMACALLANGVARLVTRPMYWELAAMLHVPHAQVDGPPAINSAERERK